MAEDTWSRREQPIREAVVRLAEADPPRRRIVARDIADETGLTKDEISYALLPLIEDDYLIGRLAKPCNGDEAPAVVLSGPTPKARGATGQWPSNDLYANFLSLLEVRIADTVDPAVKSKLRAFSHAFSNVGQSVATGVLTELIKRQTGI